MCGVTRVLLLLHIKYYLFLYMHLRACVLNFVYSRDLGAQLWTIFDDEL